MKQGDQVKFLDSTGGGMVTRVDAARKIVHVIDEDGFETPVLMSQVVVINSAQKDIANIPDPKPEQKDDTPNALAALKDGAPAAEDEYETDYGDTLCVQLAFMPRNIRVLQSTPYDVILINDSNYYLLYNIATVIDGKASVVSNGVIEPNMTDTFFTIQREDINDWEHLRIQAIPLKQKKNYEPQRVIDADIKLNLINFFKLHTFTENEYFEEPAWLINLLENQVPEQEDKTEQPLRPKHRRAPINKPLIRG